MWIETGHVSDEVPAIGKLSVRIQCGCGFMVQAIDGGPDAHYDLFDLACRRLDHHLESAEVPGVCRPWITA